MNGTRRILATVARSAVYLTGFDPRRAMAAASGLPRFLRDARRYSSKLGSGDFALHLGDVFPILTEFGEQAGQASGHYFHQDLWVARRIFLARPKRHVDIGSRLDGFVAHVLTFMPVTVVDVRPLNSPVQGLEFVRDDATTLARFEDDSLQSVSTLHAIEHFGLGRYGDPVDPESCFVAMRSLQRVLAPGGDLYFSVPIGRERVEFNAHRVFAPATSLRAFDGLTLHAFAAVDDRGDLCEGQAPEAFSASRYACGMFHFRKPA
jgi:SAM-dependent methyltransferase